MNCAIHTDQPATAYCRTCGRAICAACTRDVKGVIFCQDCLAARLEGSVPPAAVASGVMPAYVPPASSPSPGLAFFLGMIPGVGAFYNGQFVKGFVHVGVFALLIAMENARMPAPLEVLFGFGIAIWYCYMVFDAYTTAKARMLGQPLPDPLGLNSLFGANINAVQAPDLVVPPVNPAASATGIPVAGAVQQPPYPVAPPPGQPVLVPASQYSSTGAIVLIALGVLFLCSNLGIFEWNWVGRMWPLILIAIGLWLAYRRLYGTNVVVAQQQPWEPDND